jgi:hypothetical protein
MLILSVAFLLIPTAATGVGSLAWLHSEGR